MSKCKPRPCLHDELFVKQVIRLWKLTDEQFIKKCFKHRCHLASHLHEQVREGRLTWEEAYSRGKDVLGFNKPLA